MSISSKQYMLLLIIVTLLSIISYGCTKEPETGSGITVTEDSEHAGHNHAPGEHPQEAVDPHAGHDHVSDEHTEQDGSEIDGWCAEHLVPESECTLCHPELIAEFKRSGDWCAGHDLPESHCRLCNPGIEFPQEKIMEIQPVNLKEDNIEVSLFRSNSNICATNGALIQFASTGTVAKAGLSAQMVRSEMMESVIEAPAEVVFDETRMNVVTSTVSAVVTKWLISPGDYVRPGDKLAVLQSPEIARLQADLLKAVAAYDVELSEQKRHQKLHQKNLISTSEYENQKALTEQTLAELASIKGLLKSAGLSNSDIDKVIDSRLISNEFILRTRSEGVIVRRSAQIGDLLQAGQAYALVSDPRAMWVEAQLTESQLKRVRLGQSVTFTSDGYGMNRVGAKIIWISQFLDPHTRTGTVRAEIVDPHAGLNAGEFGSVKIGNIQDVEILLVHRDAVQWEGCCNVVFVKENEIKYRPRKVNLLGSTGEFYQVEGDLNAGDRVIVKGAFLLKTELKKSSIGAGCCGLEPVG